MISRVKGISALSREQKELKVHGTSGFPCAGYRSYYTDNPEDFFSWHWHEELEINYIEKGKMRVKIPSRTFLLEEGDCVILNTNMLHYGEAEGECELHALLFRSELVQGNDTSVFAEKYTTPLFSCNSFSAYHAKAADDDLVGGWFREAFHALQEEPFGYEFIVREMLSRMCLFLYRKFESQMDAKDLSLNQDNIRLRKMLTYIHEKYSEDISLEEIAGAADISERECFRCFKKTIQISPAQYLLKYRIMQGAEMLLSDAAGSISDIASACGFDSPSNFAKMFRRFYDCTPREYRNSRH